MLGRDLCNQLSAIGLSVLASSSEIDICRMAAITNFTTGKKIDWVINCAAYTSVDKAEDDSKNAFLVNAQGPLNLALWCKKSGAKLIHISTDYVFDGFTKNAYTEDDKINPLGIYGASKALGEANIASTFERYFILRTGWLYGLHGHNFIGKTLRLMHERSSITVVGDQIGTPTWTRDLINFIVSVLKNESTQYGIYHASGEGACSWHDFAELISELGVKLDLIKIRPNITKVATFDYPARAKRPAWSVLSKSKIKQVFNAKFPNWNDSVAEFLFTYQKQLRENLFRVELSRLKMAKQRRS